jgi:hypothetical protein
MPVILPSTSAITSLVDLGHDVEFAGATRASRAPSSRRAELLLLVAQVRGLLEVLAVDRRLPSRGGRGDLLVELAQVRRRRHPT